MSINLRNFSRSYSLEYVYCINCNETIVDEHFVLVNLEQQSLSRVCKTCSELYTEDVKDRFDLILATAPLSQQQDIQGD